MNSNTTKKLTINSIYNVIYRLVSALYPLIAVSYASHVLQSEKMGLVAYSQNIASYFIILSALGIPTYGTREIAKCSNNVEKRTTVFKELFIINCLSTIISTISYLHLITTINKFNENYILYLVAGMQIVFNIINVDWFFQGIEEYKYISIRNTIVKIISLILLLLCVNNKDNYIQYALIYSISVVGNNIFNVIRISKYLTNSNREKINLTRHIKPILILFAASLAVELYIMIDTTMLGIYYDNTIVGCYSNAMKLTRAVNTLSSAVGAVLFPRLSSIFENDENEQFNRLVNNGIKVMLVLSVPACVGLILLRKEIVYTLFGPSFSYSIQILRILALMVPVAVCNTLMGGQVLITANLEKQYFFSVLIASLSNIILNNIFIPRFGAVSAAYTSLLSEIIDLILYIYFARKVVKVHLSLKYISSMLIPLIVYIIISLTLSHFIDMIYSTKILINVILCLSIYFGLGSFLGNDSIKMIINKIIMLIKSQLLSRIRKTR